jgi:ABC-2 type transport system permease protein
MTALAEVYRQQMKTSFAAMLQYRAALVIWLISQVLDPVIYLIVWSAVTGASGGEVGGYTRGDFAAYFLALILVNNITYSWIMPEYEYRVREGTLSAALLRPVHPIHADVADNLASKMISTPMMLALAVGLGFIFRPEIRLVPWGVAAFVPAVALAFVLRFLIEWTLALAAFWTTRVSALNQTYYVALLFLSGQVASLSLFPGFVQAIGLALPFRWMVAFPIELLLGNLSVGEMLVGYAAQLAWIGVGLVLARVAWRAGVRQYSAVGA